MAEINEKYLNILLEAGLHVSPPLPAFRNGVFVGKPVSTPGHSIAGLNPSYIELEAKSLPPKMDAPLLKFYVDIENNWMVCGDDYAGKRGPGDFINIWETPEEAIEDILDFYFGNPSRMLAKAEGLGLSFIPMTKQDN